MLKVEYCKTEGWEAAIRGARNPLNSWDKSDSDFSNGVCIGMDLIEQKEGEK